MNEKQALQTAENAKPQRVRIKSNLAVGKMYQGVMEWRCNRRGGGAKAFVTCIL